MPNKIHRFILQCHGLQVAALVTFTQNTGAAGIINLWSPEVKPDQYSDAVIFVANDDGVVANAIVIGWAVSMCYRSPLYYVNNIICGLNSPCWNVYPTL